MERVLFHVDATLERIPCLLNPEHVIMRRSSGIRTQPSTNSVGRVQRQHDALLFTGGGRTELELQLLFDVRLGEGPAMIEDVRALTAPLWRLTYNANRPGGIRRPPLVRFIWGKAWNIPGVITDLAERTEEFNRSGRPQRSWVSLRLLQTDVPVPIISERRPVTAAALDALRAAIQPLPPQQLVTYQVIEGDSLPDLAQRFYDDAALWRLLADYNALDDPNHLRPGQVLVLPPLP